jgi:hypothetical protein
MPEVPEAMAAVVAAAEVPAALAAQVALAVVAAPWAAQAVLAAAVPEAIPQAVMAALEAAAGEVRRLQEPAARAADKAPWAAAVAAEQALEGIFLLIRQPAEH